MRSKEDIQSQLNGKAHWNAPDWEMREWLQSQHGIEGSEAESMIQLALRDKAATVRKRSLLRAMIALFVAAPLFLIAWFGWQAGGVRTTAGAVVLASAGASCLAYAGKNLYQVLTGKSDVAIDA